MVADAPGGAEMVKPAFQITPEMEDDLNQHMADQGWSLHGQGTFDEILWAAWPHVLAELRRLLEEAFEEEPVEAKFFDWLCGTEEE